MDSHSFILRQMNLHSKVWLAGANLQAAMPGTIQKSIQKSVGKADIKTVPGSYLFCSISPGYPTPRVVYQYKQKKKIAQNAITYIDETLFAVAGTGLTNMSAEHSPYFHTNSIIERRKKSMVIITGNLNSKNTIGADTITKSKKPGNGLNFLGINAVKPHSRFAHNNRTVCNEVTEPSKIAFLIVSKQLNSHKYGAVLPAALL